MEMFFSAKLLLSYENETFFISTANGISVVFGVSSLPVGVFGDSITDSVLKNFCRFCEYRAYILISFAMLISGDIHQYSCLEACIVPVKSPTLRVPIVILYAAMPIATKSMICGADRLYRRNPRVIFLKRLTSEILSATLSSNFLTIYSLERLQRRSAAYSRI